MLNKVSVLDDNIKILSVKPLQQKLIPKGVSASAFQRLWAEGYNGSGITVAVLDTGISSHPDLNVVGSVNFTNEALSSSHGTHVAGIIAASGWITGGAPGSNLLDVKVVGSGGGTVENLVKGITYAVDNAATIINVSLGTVGITRSEIDSLTSAINNAWNRGVICISASGNAGTSICTVDPYEYPASIDKTESVGACSVSEDFTISIAKFSSENNKVDLTACGVDVISTANDGGYGVASGTSMSTPYVSAMAAILAQYVKQNYPTLSGSSFSSNLVSLLRTHVLRISSCGISAQSYNPYMFIPKLDCRLLQNDIDKVIPCSESNICTRNDLTTKNDTYKVSLSPMGTNFLEQTSFVSRNFGIVQPMAENISYGLGFIRYKPNDGPFNPGGEKYFQNGIYLGNLV